MSYSKIRHIQETNMLLESRLLTEGGLRFDESLKIIIFQSFINYTESISISVDGVAGSQTTKAINTLMKDGEGKYFFPKGFSNEGLIKYYATTLKFLKNDSSDLKKLTDVNNARMLQVILCLAGNEKVIPDGNIGKITKTVMKEKLGSDDINKVKTDALQKVIDDAIVNVENSYLLFYVDGVDKSTTTNKKDTQKKPSEKDDRNKLLHAALDMLIDKVIAASPYPTFGEFKSTGVGYNVYNVQETYIAYLPPNKEFMEIARSEGFSNGGCWWYDKFYTKKIYFYKCGPGDNSSYRKKWRHYDSNLEKESYNYSKK